VRCRHGWRWKAVSQVWVSFLPHHRKLCFSPCAIACLKNRSFIRRLLHRLHYHFSACSDVKESSQRKWRHDNIDIYIRRMKPFARRRAPYHGQPSRCMASFRRHRAPSTWHRAVCRLRLWTVKYEMIYRRYASLPKPASGFSTLILSRQSWLKNMYAERARLGALGSFLPLREGFSAFSAALRDAYTRC